MPLCLIIACYLEPELFNYWFLRTTFHSFKKKSWKKGWIFSVCIQHSFMPCRSMGSSSYIFQKPCNFYSFSSQPLVQSARNSWSQLKSSYLSFCPDPTGFIFDLTGIQMFSLIGHRWSPAPLLSQAGKGPCFLRPSPPLTRSRLRNRPCSWRSTLHSLIHLLRNVWPLFDWFPVLHSQTGRRKNPFLTPAFPSHGVLMVSRAGGREG